jgi:hypothetical protein
MNDNTNKTEFVDSASDERVVNNVMRHAYRVLSDSEKAQMQKIKDVGLAAHTALYDRLQVLKDDSAVIIGLDTLTHTISDMVPPGDMTLGHDTSPLAIAIARSGLAISKYREAELLLNDALIAIEEAVMWSVKAVPK